MEITEVRIKLMEDSDDRLQAFCSITIDDCFVIRDLKIIEGTSGPFVAMPSRKLTSHCPHCGMKNHLRSGYCNNCGGRLKDDRTVRDQDGRAKLYADIAHPINSQCREMIQKHVIQEYRAERERAKLPDYVSRYDDSYEDEFESAELAEEYDRVKTDQDATKRRTGERTQIQPAEVEPRPPHLSPSQLPTREPPRRGSDQFGAGIFD
jgi:stage V sporulation protein G